MNKRGFTLIELLAVIIVLGIIITIAVVSVMGINKNIKDNMLEKKIDMIEEVAVMYGEDYYKDAIINSNEYYEENPCLCITVSDLVDYEYLDADNDNNCGETPGCVVDPSDESIFLDNKYVVLYYKYKRIYAEVDLENKCACE